MASRKWPYILLMHFLFHSLSIYNTFFVEDDSFIEQFSFFRLNFLIILDVAEMHLGQFQLPLWRFFEF